MDKDVKNSMGWLATTFPIMIGAMLLYSNSDMMTGLLFMSVAFVLSRLLYDRLK